ncbi:MAG TPA: peptidoglycan-binding domain-containing protein [Terriglobia bacterium]|nr:peptidoglycan-binding domain-containing protein [Terriglobia bacterium]
MTRKRNTKLNQIVGITGLAAFLALGAAAPAQVTVPAGTVVDLQTTSALDSGSAQQGDTFSSTVRRSVYVSGRVAIAQASSVDGRVTEVRPAVLGSQSGVIGVEFFRLVLADGTSYDLSGALTSRRQGDNGPMNDTGRRNVIIGGSGRTVIGALSGGAYGTNSGTINSLLSSGSEAQLPLGSNIAMELVNAITIGANPQQSQYPSGNNNGAGYTSPRMVRSAQSALHDRNAYDGPMNGRLDGQTRQALANFQSQNGLPVTGDLDQRTAGLLGLVVSGQGNQSIDRQLAASIYRKAQSLVNNYQSSLGIRVNDIRAGLTSSRILTEGDLDLLLQANSFMNAAAWYQQATTSAPNNEGYKIAADILQSSAQRVETSLQSAQDNPQFRQMWSGVQSDMNQIGANTSNYNNNSNNDNSGQVTDYNSGQVSSTGHFQWQGLVDGSDNIRLQGSNVNVTHLSAAPIQEASHQLSAALPYSPVQVTLNKVRGRGQIRLLEQPTASNNYTAVVQVDDQSQQGNAWYEFTLDW